MLGLCDWAILWHPPRRNIGEIERLAPTLCRPRKTDHAKHRIKEFARFIAKTLPRLIIGTAWGFGNDHHIGLRIALRENHIPRAFAQIKPMEIRHCSPQCV